MSLVQKQFKGQIANWIAKLLKMQKEWSVALQMLKGHLANINAVAFLLNSKLVALALWDNTVWFWDLATDVVQ